MSESNADIRQDECCGESINGDENDDLFDDLNTIDDSEVLKEFHSLECQIFVFVIRKIVVL
jgi:hypothetical protein